jgi:hypothetical protein
MTIESFAHANRLVRHFGRLRGFGSNWGDTTDARELVRRVDAFTGDSYFETDERGKWLIAYAAGLRATIDEADAAEKGAA